MYTFYLVSLSSSYNEKYFPNFVKKNETHTRIIRPVIFFSRKSWRSWDNVEKYRRVGQATDDNMAHAQSMLDT